ncbi:MAG TPA: diguanylate cyclase [Anaeromyxobacter sp.]|nr:diguanylate cyclase [Anaeromyxobacter sp.]
MSAARPETLLVTAERGSAAERLRRVLERRGHAVSVLADGPGALARIRASCPELVVADVALPGLDGYALCAAVRAERADGRPPFLLLAPLASPRDLLRVLACGADQLALQPVAEPALLARVEELLRPAGERPSAGPGSVSFEGETFRIAGAEDRILSLLFSAYGEIAAKHRQVLDAQGQLEALNIRLAAALDEARAAVRRAEELSLQDPLTGLANRRMLEIAAGDCLARAQRYGAHFSVAMADLDHFKKLNDSLGHVQGDRTLQRVAELLRSSVRRTDLAVRHGGEEFLVLLEETRLDGAAIFAERLRARVEGQCGVTVSVGVAEHRPDEGFEELVRRADDALYQAKREGRNRIARAA